MTIEILKVSPDASAFKGRIVREHEKIMAQNAKEADYKRLLKELEVEII